MNNSTNKWLSGFSILLLTANIITLVLLWNNKHNESRPAHIEPPPNGPVFEFINKELNLTQAQQETYKLLREDHQAAQRVLQDSIRKSKDAFFELLKSPAVHDSVLLAASNKELVYQQQLELLTFKHFQKLRALCTPAQQQQFDTIIRQVLLQMGGPRMRMGPPPMRARRDSEDIQVPPGDDKNHPGDRPPPLDHRRGEDGPPPPGDIPPARRKE